MPVYFVQAGDGGPIKIGYARNVQSRLGKMRVDCPLPLLLLAVAEGDVDYERRLHERFEHYWRKGEWFSPAPDLLALIATLPAPPPTRRMIKDGDHPLRQYRCNNSLTLQEVAIRVGTTHATISRIENGLLKPTFDLLGRLVAATGVSADAILEHARRAGRAPSSEAA